MCSTSLQPTDVINWWLKIGAGDQIILKQPMIIKRCQMIARGGSRWVPGKGHRLWYCKLLCGVAWYCKCMVILYGIACYCMVSVSLTNNIASADQRTPRSPPNLTKLLSKSSLNWAAITLCKLSVTRVGQHQFVNRSRKTRFEFWQHHNIQRHCRKARFFCVKKISLKKQGFSLTFLFLSPSWLSLIQVAPSPPSSSHFLTF